MSPPQRGLPWPSVRRSSTRSSSVMELFIFLTTPSLSEMTLSPTFLRLCCLSPVGHVACPWLCPHSEHRAGPVGTGRQCRSWQESGGVCAPWGRAGDRHGNRANRLQSRLVFFYTFAERRRARPAKAAPLCHPRPALCPTLAAQPFRARRSCEILDHNRWGEFPSDVSG